jgi:hypothetical protein
VLQIKNSLRFYYSSFRRRTLIKIGCKFCCLVTPVALCCGHRLSADALSPAIWPCMAQTWCSGMPPFLANLRLQGLIGDKGPEQRRAVIISAPVQHSNIPAVSPPLRCESPVGRIVSSSCNSTALCSLRTVPNYRAIKTHRLSKQAQWPLLITVVRPSTLKGRCRSMLDRVGLVFNPNVQIPTVL